jgi:hypothetical protein
MLFEPSGVARVHGGWLVLDDELLGSVLFVAHAESGGRAALVKIQRGKEERAPIAKGVDRFFPVQDFEGIATDGEKRVFLIGSHCGKREEDGTVTPNPDREFLIEAEWDFEERRLDKARRSENLLKVVKKVVKPTGLDISTKRCKRKGFLNIEGLAFDKEHDRLFVGFRYPLVKGKAVVAALSVAAAFSDKGDGKSDGKGAVLLLDLGNRGIRDIECADGSLWIIAGASDDERTPFSLWRCDTNGENLAHVHQFCEADLALPGGGIGSPEGLSLIERTAEGQHTFMVALDSDGSHAGVLLRVGV